MDMRWVYKARRSLILNLSSGDTLQYKCGFTSKLKMFRSKFNLKHRVAKSVGVWHNHSKRASEYICYGENMREYLKSTSLHGLKYVGSGNITLFERVFFFLSFILVLILSAYYISNVYEKWSATPVIVTMSATSTPITDFPFPAVTICNINKARYSVATKFANGSAQSVWLQNICYNEYANVSVKIDDSHKQTNWNGFREFLLNISQPCSEMLIMCRFALDSFKCMDAFDTVLSDEGLCCIFNSVEPEFLYKNPLNASGNFDDDIDSNTTIPIDWTPEKGYANATIKKKSSPRPAAGAGSHLGLYVMLNGDVSDYYCSSTNSAGFKILLHNPTETPRISNYGMLVSPGYQTRVIITPRINTATRKIRRIPIQNRQCVFSSETNLRYFRTYSRRNCEMECFSNIIEQACGCVMYYMPRINRNSKVCNRDDSECYNPIRISLERGDNLNYKCDCLPGCDELSFGGDISTSPLATQIFGGQLHNFSQKKISRDIAIVEIFYAESFFRSYVKNELIGFTEFLSNIGGLLGLFMGFSVVSMVEILYFISLRLYCRQFYGKKGPNDPSKGVKTISKIISKNQRHVWPSVYHQHNAARVEPVSNRHYHNRIIHENTRKPNHQIIYPYLD